MPISACVTFALCWRRSTSRLCLTATGDGEGVPCGESFAPVTFIVPVTAAVFPSDITVSSTVATPAIPLAGSTNPEAAIFTALALTLALNGVLRISARRIGPALPETAAFEPPGKLIVSLNGNDELNEKPSASRLKPSYTRLAPEESVRANVTLPSVNWNFFTSTAGIVEAGGAPLFCTPPAILEKLNVPSGDCSTVICGWLIRTSVTFKCFERISGTISTPISTDFAVRKADLLKAGSSATSTSLVTSFPERIERLMLPSFTGRPTTWLALDSSIGRNLFTSIRNGKAIIANRSATTTALAMSIQRVLFEELGDSIVVLRGAILDQIRLSHKYCGRRIGVSAGARESV